MDNGKAANLVLVATVVLSAAAWEAIVALGGSGELAVVGMLAVMGLGLPQMSRLIMRDDRRR
jgi:hypothetical protein